MCWSPLCCYTLYNTSKHSHTCRSVVHLWILCECCQSTHFILSAVYLSTLPVCVCVCVCSSAPPLGQTGTNLQLFIYPWQTESNSNFCDVVIFFLINKRSKCSVIGWENPLLRPSSLKLNKIPGNCLELL